MRPIWVQAPADPSICGFFAHILDQLCILCCSAHQSSYTSYCNQPHTKYLLRWIAISCYCDRIYSARAFRRALGSWWMMCGGGGGGQSMRSHALSKRPESGSGFALLCRCACAAMRIASGRRHKQLFAHSISRFDWICQVVYRIPTGSSHWQCTLKWNVFWFFFRVFRTKMCQESFTLIKCIHNARSMVDAIMWWVYHQR